jgi:hypothetical protein
VKENFTHGSMRGAMKKYLGAREARVCKLPSQADRAELLCSACKATRHYPILP